MGELNDWRMVCSLFDRYGPVVTMDQADRAGVARGAVRRVEHRGQLLRLAKSAFTDTRVYEEADSWERFRLQSLAVGLSACRDTFLAGEAALTVHGLPTLGEPPERPRAVRPGDAHRGPNLSAHARVRTGWLPSAHQTIRHRVRVVSAEYLAVDIARHNGPLHGLMVADRVLHDGGLRESMSRLVGEMRNYPGIETAAWALTHADGRSESPVETIGRYAFLEAGLTPPLSNVWITDGRSVRRVDHLLADDGIVLECDGDVKYSGPDAAAVIDDEKSRERWLRALGLSVIRYGYRRAVYARGGILAEVARERRARAGRPAPQCWSLDNPLAA